MEILVYIVLGFVILCIVQMIRNPEPKVTRIHHQGHDYLVIQRLIDYSPTYVHDPDCPCHKDQ